MAGPRFLTSAWPSSSLLQLRLPTVEPLRSRRKPNLAWWWEPWAICLLSRCAEGLPTTALTSLRSAQFSTRWSRGNGRFASQLLRKPWSRFFTKTHRCLEKDPEQRFYSAHDLAFALEALSDWTISPAPSGPAQESTKPNRMRFATAGVSLVLMLGAAVLAYLWMRPEPVPKVSNYVQLTHDGKHKWLAGTDGSRLYLSYGAYAGQSIAEISISGGNLN